MERGSNPKLQEFNTKHERIRSFNFEFNGFNRNKKKHTSWYMACGDS